ncbi:uncharacterized protein [Dermacentor albipictus]|uniref:uncharacterized protein isoform X2 n=1 Tax=Dermacentor albipictus TaxID=60249 RepID=UPI0038FBF2E7
MALGTQPSCHTKDSACSSPDIMSLGPRPAQHRMPTPCQTPRDGRCRKHHVLTQGAFAHLLSLGMLLPHEIQFPLAKKKAADAPHFRKYLILYNSFT